MIRAALILMLLAIAFPAQANSTWSRLWLNPDQRAEKLLQQGDASAAAKEYRDPRRKAYAEMKAGDFKQAASDLGKLHDSDSDYNRGNALAKMGGLKDALDAYDAALKIDPKNHDAQHNRDLVEKALKQQQQNKQQNRQQNGKQQDKSGGKQGSNSGGQGSQSGKNASGSNGKNGQQSSDKNSSKSGKSGGNPAGENSSAQQNAQSGADENPGSSGNQAQQNQQKKPGQNKDNSDAQSGQGQAGANTASQQQTGKTGKQSANGQSADEAAQVKKDAEAGLAANKPGAAGNRIDNTAPADQTAPLSEQQLSKEQWLRSITDDPGGLLRRKFMIEYMLRQQKAQP